MSFFGSVGHFFGHLGHEFTHFFGHDVPRFITHEIPREIPLIAGTALGSALGAPLLGAAVGASISAAEPSGRGERREIVVRPLPIAASQSVGLLEPVFRDVQRGFGFALGEAITGSRVGGLAGAEILPQLSRIPLIGGEPLAPLRAEIAARASPEVATMPLQLKFDPNPFPGERVTTPAPQLVEPMRAQAEFPELTGHQPCDDCLKRLCPSCGQPMPERVTPLHEPARRAAPERRCEQRTITHCWLVDPHTGGIVQDLGETTA